MVSIICATCCSTCGFFPDGRTVELDWDEFEQAARASLISADEQQAAVAALRKMVEETKAGIFPSRYII